MSLLPGLEVPPKTEADISDQQPMDLFPQHAGLGVASPAEEKAQLPIFCGGRKLVFDNFPADKAKDLMLMAGKSKSVDPPAAAPVVGEARALPFARRASIHSFMEKRRERIHSSKAPYQKDGSSTIRTYLPWFRKDLPGMHSPNLDFGSKPAVGNQEFVRHISPDDIISIVGALSLQ